MVSAPTNPSAPPAAAGSAPSAPALAKEKKRKHRLATDNDPIFSELRDLNFSNVGRRLSRVARRLDEEYKVAIVAYYNLTFSVMLTTCIRPGTKLRHPLNCATSSASWVG